MRIYKIEKKQIVYHVIGTNAVGQLLAAFLAGAVMIVLPHGVRDPRMPAYGIATVGGIRVRQTL